MRVIGDAGDQLGVMPVEEALKEAGERGLDLVEVAPMARPPVVSEATSGCCAGSGEGDQRR